MAAYSFLRGMLDVVRGLVRIALAPVRVVAAPFGCLITSLLSTVFILGIAFLLFYLIALQHSGPHIQNGLVTVRGSNGVARTHSLTEDAANLFDVKVELGERQSADASVLVILDEGDLNAKLWSLLQARHRQDPGYPVDSIVVVLTPDTATFHLNGDALGRTVGVRVRVRFEVTGDRHLDLAVDQVKLGGLPSVPFSKQLADLVFRTSALDDEFESALPENVRDVRIEEGQLVVEVGAPVTTALDSP